LCERFGPLYLLSDYKAKSVLEIFSLGWREGGEAWKWWRLLFAWEEEMVDECKIILLD